MNCKLVVNRDSGNFDRLDVDALLRGLECDAQVEIIDSKSDWNADGFDTVIVCGGDGTLHNAVEKCRGKKIVYAPCGTLNETALTHNRLTSLGKVNDQPFCYVCAAGSFTEIGYSAKNNRKKHWKSLAYLPQIFKFYRCRQIEARLDVDGKKTEGCFTLIMVLKSHRCFGFCFNKDFKKTQKNYLLTVKSPGKDTLKNRVKMFFPFFRIFFLGAQPQTQKGWMLTPFDNLTVDLKEPQDFCLDGEKRRMQGRLKFSQTPLQQPVEVVKTPVIRRKRAFVAFATDKTSN